MDVLSFSNEQRHKDSHRHICPFYYIDEPEIGITKIFIEIALQFPPVHPSHIHSFVPSPCAECDDDSLPFSGASSIPLCYVLIPATLLHQLFFHPLSPHLAIYFLVYLSV